MKKNILVSILLLLVGICSTQTVKPQTVNATFEKEKIFTIDKLLDRGQALTGKKICFTGVVKHTCRYSGKRCFVTTRDEAFSIRVEAAGQIKSFDKSLIGKTLRIKGILKEKRVTTKMLDEIEAERKALNKEKKHCGRQFKEIEKMRKWMKVHQKDYYPVYFILGESYEVVG